MSAATASSTDVTIFVRLVDEGVDVWRPVQARRLSETTYQIADEAIPEGEAWAFSPGDIVVAEHRGSERDASLVAVALATHFDDRSWTGFRKAG